MNILIATVFPLPGGGIWSFVSNLSEKLVKQGHKVDILCTSDNNSKVVILNGQTIVNLNPYRSSVQRRLLRAVPHVINNPWVYHAEMNRYVFEQGVSTIDLTKYDIIHAQDVLCAVALSRLKRAQVPLVTSIHGFLSGAIFHQYKSINLNMSHQEIWNTFVLRYYSRMEQIGYEASDYIHTSSYWLRKIIETQFNISPSKIKTFKYGVKLSDFIHESSPWKVNGKKIILANSRLVYLKGLHHLIEALSFLKSRNDWECWILGEGELENSLKKDCKNLGIEKDVIFWGNTSKVKEILQQSYMLVLPSLLENQPFAVIEAQLLGVPTIVSDAGGLPEMVEHNKNGFIVERENSRKLSERIEYLLNNQEKRDQMSQYAKVQGEKMWDVNRLSRNTVQLYANSIKLHQK
ncbi:glycosyltransferase family 4 protein [Bacillus sp. BHET2]|uniref:glycosyltransferase family 4 protein n=1 Tax=Bacillus sp. BHET2 TaxID=2583818 RepID=UPI0014866136|nr:glycosyltransferase family 4 protein [Bacillus sp. BHET2]